MGTATQEGAQYPGIQGQPSRLCIVQQYPTGEGSKAPSPEPGWGGERDPLYDLTKVRLLSPSSG